MGSIDAVALRHLPAIATDHGTRTESAQLRSAPGTRRL
jgi:hypothetical protein